MDLTASIAPRSDQINADDMISGPLTVTIESVTPGNDDQPVNVALVERPGRAYRPSKSMRRVLVMAWGADSNAYIGRRMTLYRNPEITFGRDKVGGIEVSHLSHIDRPMAIPLTATRGKKRLHQVKPLADETPAVRTMPKFETKDEALAYYRRRESEGATPAELAEIASVGTALPDAEPSPEPEGS